MIFRSILVDSNESVIKSKQIISTKKLKEDKTEPSNSLSLQEVYNSELREPKH